MPPPPPPDVSAPPEIELQPAREQKESSATKGDFSFAGLLDEAHSAPPPPAEEPRASLAQDYPDTTAPGRPSEELLAESRRGPEPEPESAAPEPAPEPFPGDEPTRIEPVSAALLDKLRERDEEAAAPPADDLERTTESAPPQMEEPPAPPPEPPAPPPAPEANVTLSDFSMPAVDGADPDEQHWHETYDRFRELKAQLGEAPDKISFEKFAAKLKKNRADLVAKHNCKGVRFSVYEKEGKAAIKASAIR
jgi:hypothetical protein